MFTNREIALACWSVPVLIYLCTKPELRSSLVYVLRAFFRAKVIGPVILFVGWLASWVWIADWARLWNVPLLKDTIVWIAFSGIALQVNSIDATKEEHFFWRILLSTLGVTTVLGYLVGLESLNLAAELVLQPALIVLVMLSIVARTDKQYIVVQRMLDICIGIIGCFLLFRTTAYLVGSWNGLDRMQLGRSFLLPIWLTLVALPYLYGFALVAGYELVFMRMGLSGGSRRTSRMVKLALLRGLNFRLKVVHEFVGAWPGKLAAARNYAEAIEVIRSFQKSRMHTPLYQRKTRT